VVIKRRFPAADCQVERVGRLIRAFRRSSSGQLGDVGGDAAGLVSNIKLADFFGSTGFNPGARTILDAPGAAHKPFSRISFGWRGWTPSISTSMF
jgi:hypothetical protein